MILRYSMIDAFLQCPMKFYKSYILKEREETKSSALEYGSALHLALKTHFEGGDPYSIFNMYWDSMKEANLEYQRLSWEDLKNATNNTFLPNFLRLHSKKFKNVKFEEELTMPIMDNHILQGTFDLCGEYEGILTMVDWKTSSREYNFSRIQKNPQLYIYSALYQYKYGVLPKQIMYKVAIKPELRWQTLKISLDEKKLELHMSNLYRIIKHMLLMIESNEFYSNYNCYCRECLK